MKLILIRYGEIGLKSAPVRKRFENILISNISKKFLFEGLECTFDRDWGRIYLRTKSTREAVKILKKIFGITSISIAQEVTADLDDICKLVEKISKRFLLKGDSFAIRARRSGNHAYSSQELAAIVGERVRHANKEKAISVNLTTPDKEIFIEVRNNKAFVFTEIIQAAGGLPVGSQGNVIVPFKSKSSILAAWFLMKRGCRAYLTLTALNKFKNYIECLREWDCNLQVFEVPKKDILSECMKIANKINADALVSTKIIRNRKLNIPVLYPLAGLSFRTTIKMIKKICAS